MKKVIGLYKEFGGENERMADSFCKEPYRGQGKVAKYLRNGGVLLNCAPSILRDVFTGEKISEPQSTRSDDFYI